MGLSEILTRAKSGDEHARAEVVKAAYEDLRRIAQSHMSNQRPDHTLTSTALVNELALKLLSEESIPTDSRVHFLAYAAKAMRNLLIDHARSKRRKKRGGHLQKVVLVEACLAAEQQADELLALNEALEQLAIHRPRQAKVVEMRYFGGLKLEDIASALEVSLATVKRDWEIARTLLLASITEHEDSKRD